MTRINVGINPEELDNDHLLAEHREIKRVPNTIKSDEIDNKKEQINNEFKYTMKKVAEGSKDLLDQLNLLKNKKGTISKSEINEIFNMAYNINMNLSENSHFVYKQFQEQMEKTVLEAKSEIEAHISHQITRFGTKALENLSKESQILEIENNE